MTTAGLTKGDRVATLLMNGHEFVESFYGLAKVGGVIVALNWRLVADELAFILNDSGAEKVLFGTPFTSVCAELRSRGVGVTKVTRWIHVGDDAATPDWADHYETMLAAASDDETDTTTAADDDLLFIMYTSGTTGSPKGVMHSHATTLWAMITATTTAGVRKGDRYLISLPPFHVGALNPLTSTFYQAATCVIMSEFDPVRIWDLFAEEKISVTLAVPAALQFMLSTLDKDRHDYCSLRWVMSGASPVPVNLIETYARMGIEIHEVYGLTEIGQRLQVHPASVTNAVQRLERDALVTQAANPLDGRSLLAEVTSTGSRLADWATSQLSAEVVSIVPIPVAEQREVYSMLKGMRHAFGDFAWLGSAVTSERHVSADVIRSPIASIATIERAHLGKRSVS